MNEPASGQIRCEPVSELFAGSNGRMLLGRMLDGPHHGRVVLLREITSAVEGLTAFVAAAQSIAHPRVMRVLGIAYSGACPYLASEYAAGVSLLELNAALRKQRTALLPSVAVRIVHGGLRVVAAAQSGLRDPSGAAYSRCFYPDTLWVAENGHVLVSEVGLAPMLNGARPGGSEVEARARDALTAGLELVQLISGKPTTRETLGALADQLPKPLADVVHRVFKQPETIGGPEAWARLLETLPSSLMASDEAVVGELTRVARPLLAARRREVEVFHSVPPPAEVEESTHIFSAPVAEEPTTHFRRPDGYALDQDATEETPWDELPTRIDTVKALKGGEMLPTSAPPGPPTPVPDAGRPGSGRPGSSRPATPASARPASARPASARPASARPSSARATQGPSRWQTTRKVLSLLAAVTLGLVIGRHLPPNWWEYLAIR